MCIKITNQFLIGLSLNLKKRKIWQMLKITILKRLFSTKFPSVDLQLNVNSFISVYPTKSINPGLTRETKAG